MGTPDFAVASLEKIIEAGHEVLAVVTVPDKPAGRGQKLTESAVKKCAQKNNLKILQPEKLKNEAFISELKNLNAELFVVVAFRMLPEIVWNMPAKGTINLHGSLLPQYRGAAPINWAVINGEKETGVTTFFIQQEIDTGNILQHRKIEIAENDTAGTVHDKLMIVGAELLVETINKLEKGELKAIPQENLIKETELKHAPKIFRNTCQINWDDTTDKILNLIRGLSPYPAAFTNMRTADKTTEGYKIFAVRKEAIQQLLPSGTIETDDKKYLKVYTSDGAISILEIQQPGKKKMSIEEFLRGNTISSNSKFVSLNHTEQ